MRQKTDVCQETEKRQKTNTCSALCLYLCYLAISIRSQMQYRASFIMMAIGHLTITGSEFLCFWALFDR